jgi:type I restriction enzyme S subunit
MTALPRGWTSLPLSEVGRWVGGGTPSKAEPTFWNGTIPWVSPKDMKSLIIRDTQDHVTADAVRQSSTNYVEAGSVLVVFRSGILQHTLPVAIAAKSVTLNQDLKAVKPVESVEPSYLAWALRAFQHEILHTCSKEGTTVQSLNLASFLAFEIPLPTIEEQRRIVAEIEKQFARLDAANVALKHARDHSDRYTSTVLTHALSRHTSDAKWIAMRDAGEIQLGRQRAPQHHSGPHMRPYLRVANVLEGTIDTRDVKFMNFSPKEFERYCLRPGDILLNEGQSLEFVGRPAIYRGQIADCCYQKTLLRFRAQKHVLTDYALLVFRSYMRSGRFARSASITTNIAHLTAEKFADIEFPLISLARQRQLVVSVDQQLTAVDRLEVEIERNLLRAGALRQSILQKAFSGQI